MKTEKKYPLRGGEVTAKEAADHFHISIHSIRARLGKTGDNMEAVYAYYENRYGGGNADMRKISEADMDEFRRKQKEERAKQELEEILCGGSERRIPKEIVDSAPTGYDAEPKAVELPAAEPARVIQVDTETGTMMPVEIEYGRPLLEGTTVGGIMIEENRQEQIERKSLRLHNEAISALDALIRDGIEDDAATEKAEELLDRLRNVRMNAFEHMVPWEKLAREGK